MSFERVDTTANRIRTALDRLGMRQTDLARKAGIDKGSMSHYLKGKYEPKQDVIFAIAKALDVSEMWLWGYDCAMERPLEHKKNDAMNDIIIRMRTDEDFFLAVETLNGLDHKRFSAYHQMLTLLKQSED